MAPTFRDVAKLAGVSTQTVSRVTNGAENVAESTRKKVNAAIKQLGYVPNKGAQMLSRSKSKSIGLVTLDMALHGAAMIANGVRIQSHTLNYGTAFSAVSEPSLDNIREAIRELISQQVDSIILNVPLTSLGAYQLVEQYQHLNLIFIDVPTDTQVHYVCGNHKQGAEQALQHLIDGERHQFVLISGPKESSASQIRYRRWSTMLAEQKLAINYEYEGDWQAKSGYMAVKEAIAHQARFDAILVANDQMALGALRALHEMKIDVPGQVAVVGFDGIEDSAYFHPPLTTIRQDFTAIGKQAVQLAVQINEGAAEGFLQEQIPTKILQRESSQKREKSHYHKDEIVTLLNKVKMLLPE